MPNHTWLTVPESSNDRAARLKLEGNWKAFQAAKHAAVEAGLSVKKAYWKAAEAFPHPNEPDPSLPRDSEDPKSAPADDAGVGKEGAAPESAALAIGALKRDREIVKELALAALGRRASGNEVVRWVLDRIEIPWSTIEDDPDSVPAPSAVTMLRMAKQSDSGVLELIKHVWTKGSVQKAESVAVPDDVAEPEIDDLFARLQEAASDARG